MRAHRPVAYGTMLTVTLTVTGTNTGEPREPLCPDLVNEVLQTGDLIEDYGAYEDNYGAFAVQTPKPFHERTRNGAFGDATQATQEAGEEIVEATVERAVAFAEDFILLRQRQGEAVDAPRND